MLRQSQVFATSTCVFVVSVHSVKVSSSISSQTVLSACVCSFFSKKVSVLAVNIKTRMTSKSWMSDDARMLHASRRTLAATIPIQPKEETRENGDYVRSFLSGITAEWWYFVATPAANIEDKVREDDDKESEQAPPGMYLVGVLLAAPSVGLVSLQVHPNHRRRGIGQWLLSAYVDKMRTSSKLEYITLTTESTNTPALQLYRKLGFEIAENDQGSMIGDMVCRKSLR